MYVCRSLANSLLGELLVLTTLSAHTRNAQKSEFKHFKIKQGNLKPINTVLMTAKWQITVKIITNDQFVVKLTSY